MALFSSANTTPVGNHNAGLLPREPRVAGGIEQPAECWEVCLVHVKSLAGFSYSSSAIFLSRSEFAGAITKSTRWRRRISSPVSRSVPLKNSRTSSDPCGTSILPAARFSRVWAEPARQTCPSGSLRSPRRSRQGCGRIRDPTPARRWARQARRGTRDRWDRPGKTLAPAKPVVAPGSSEALVEWIFPTALRPQIHQDGTEEELHAPIDKYPQEVSHYRYLPRTTSGSRWRSI
jgi:hypothetical protein